MSAIDRLRRGGIRRLGTPASGFRYVRADGRAVGAADLARIRALRLPPAWRDVHVSPAAGAKLQAIGRDKAGRWQYRYHPEFVRRRSAAKYRRLVRFAEALPRVRARVERDFRRRGLGRERVLAGMTRILEATAMRPGSEAYARENGSFGLATVRPSHVRVRGGRVVFDYRGKSGQQHVREVRDRRIASLVRALLAVPGRDVFKFVEAGQVIDVRRRHLNAYLREAAGAPFTAKDFRTWAGTLLCASELALRERELVPGRTSRKRMAQAAVKAVAERLGNTPAVARGSYISPAVLEAFARGQVVRSCLEPGDVLGLARGGGLHPAERALTLLLRGLAAGADRAPRKGARVAARPEDARPAGAVGKPVRRAARRPETA
ncbi:DNA topoisomerase IB [Anaeromyxobacter sp. Fw109-5]|uniref:DNA topoisomerase IB n=1 Tax=Anaeromyxobacter sp. (strain Fw109-5) TaxID=404589 RepID=UPI000158A52D|nr:DNA topoisomerase IB [Anaeromyxobacter sp. Fw109-5]ABS25913.1 type I topoisomerase [Anaeromyxobacter sp. Fw109-5]